MTDFIVHLNKLKKKRLQELESAYDAENQKAVESLKSQVETSKQNYQHSKDVLIEQAVSKHKFGRQQAAQFELSQLQISLVNDLWTETTTKYFSQAAHLTAWLDKGVAQLAGKSGTVRAGASYSYLKKTLKSAKLSLEKTDELAQEPGFIFESEHLQIDYTLSAYLTDLFAQFRDQIFRNLFTTTKTKSTGS